MIGFHQPFFAGNFVARVLPVWILQWRLFGNQVMFRRLLIGGGRADEDQLIRYVTKQSKVAFDIIYGVRKEVHNRVEIVTSQE